MDGYNLFNAFSSGQKFSSRNEANIFSQKRILAAQFEALKKAATKVGPKFSDTVHERKYYYLGDRKVK